MSDRADEIRAELVPVAIDLLDDFDAIVDAARRLGADGAVGRAAAARDGSAAPVEDGQADAVFVGNLGDFFLGLVERPVCHQEAAVFVAV